MSLSSDFLWVVDIHQPTALLPTSDTRFCSSYLHLWEHSCQYAEQALGNSSYAFVFKLKVCIFNRSGRRFLWWEMLLLKAQSYGFFFYFVCSVVCFIDWLSSVVSSCIHELVTVLLPQPPECWGFWVWATNTYELVTSIAGGLNDL